MKNYLKDKRVLVGLLIAGALGYYFYDQNRKAMIKAKAEKMADTPAPTPIVSPKRQISNSLDAMQKEVM
jgi:hypothetical protein